MDPQSKSAKNAEAGQLRWGIEIFQHFLVFAAKHGLIAPSQLTALQGELGELTQATNEADDRLVEQLNRTIATVNSQIKKNSDPKSFAPFPPFTVALETHRRSAVLDQLDMVERTLTEAGEAGVIAWDEENDAFKNLLQVFSKVEGEKLSPEEGIASLAAEMERVNQSLPEEHRLPIPDLSSWGI